MHALSVIYILGTCEKTRPVNTGSQTHVSNCEECRKNPRHSGDLIPHDWTELYSYRCSYVSYSMIVLYIPCASEVEKCTYKANKFDF